MIPKHFRNDDTQAIFRIDYADGESVDYVVCVRVRDDLQAGDVAVIEVCYPMDHGSGLHVGRIEKETKDSISFTVLNPQLPMLDGVVTLTRTGERYV